VGEGRMTHFSVAAWGTHWGLLILGVQRKHSGLYMSISPNFSFYFSFLFSPSNISSFPSFSRALGASDAKGLGFTTEIVELRGFYEEAV